MKRVGELYEIVTFTASIAKVGEDAPKHVDRERLTLYSTVIRCWTSWISTMSSSTGCSERAAMSTRAITSRTCLRSGGIWKIPSLSTILHPHTSSTPIMQYRSVAGSQIHTTPSCSIWYHFSRTWPLFKMSDWSLVLQLSAPLRIPLSSICCKLW